MDKLVFVQLKSGHPRRKVAVPINAGDTWESFIGVIKSKLRIAAVSKITFATSGGVVRTLDELQDVDELIVEEKQATQAMSTLPSGVDAVGATGVATDALGDSSSIVQASQPSSAPYNDASNGLPDDEEQKYARKGSTWRRYVNRFLPPSWQPTLPVTTKDTSEERPTTTRRGRRRVGRSSLRRQFTLIVSLACIGGFMLLMYWRLFARIDQMADDGSV